MCTAYGWVCSCSTLTAHNTLTALTSVHLWCVSTVDISDVHFLCWKGAHTLVCVVTTPHRCTSQHTPMCPHCTFMCTVCIELAHTGKRCLHTTLPQAPITKTRSTWDTADIIPTQPVCHVWIKSLMCFPTEMFLRLVMHVCISYLS